MLACAAGPLGSFVAGVVCLISVIRWLMPHYLASVWFVAGRESILCGDCRYAAAAGGLVWLEKRPQLAIDTLLELWRTVPCRWAWWSLV